MGKGRRHASAKNKKIKKSFPHPDPTKFPRACVQNGVNPISKKVIHTGESLPCLKINIAIPWRLKAISCRRPWPGDSLPVFLVCVNLRALSARRLPALYSCGARGFAAVRGKWVRKHPIVSGQGFGWRR